MNGVSRIRKLGSLVISIMIVISLVGCKSDSSKHTKEQSKSQTIAKVIDWKEKAGKYIEDTWREPRYEEGEYCIQYYIGLDGNAKLVSRHEIKDQPYSYRIYTRKDEGWYAANLEGIPSSQENGYLSRLMEVREGEMFLFYETKVEAENDSVYTLYDYHENTKELEEISPKEWFQQESSLKEESVGIGDIAVNASGQMVYFVYGLNELHLYDSENGKNQVLVGDDDIQSLRVGKDCIYYITCDKKFKVYDIKQGVVTQNVTLNEIDNTSKVVLSPSEEVYIAGAKGILQQISDSNEWTLLIGGKDCALGKTDLFIPNIELLQKEHPEFIFAASGSGQGLTHIYYSIVNGDQNKNELTIYSLTSCDAIRSVVTQFKVEHPEIKVKYTEALEKSEYDLAEDEIRTVNTHLLAGEGADIYIMDSLPGRQLMEKGVFADLNTALQTQLENHELVENVVDCYRQKTGEIYELPMKFAPILLIQNNLLPDEIISPEKMVSVMKDHNEYECIFNNSMQDLLFAYFWSNGNELVKENQFNTELWKSIMSDMIQINQYPSSEKPENYNGDTLVGYRYIYTNPDIYSGYEGAIRGLPGEKCIATIFPLHHSFDLLMIQAMAEQYDCHYSSVDHCFMTEGRLAINANSEHMEDAISFIQYAFSEEGQNKSSFINNDIMINKKSLEAAYRLQYLCDKDEKLQAGGPSIHINRSKLTEKDVQKAVDYVSSVNQPVLEDTALLTLLASESAQVLFDGVDLDRKAGELTNKVELYLAE